MTYKTAEVSLNVAETSFSDWPPCCPFCALGTTLDGDIWTVLRACLSIPLVVMAVQVSEWLTGLT